jgi:hypothetical protein
MANTLVLLERVTVGAAGAASITFNSIPQTGYTDLVIKASSRNTDTSSAWGNYKLTMNGSSSAIYNDRAIYGSGSAAASFSNSSATYQCWRL